MNIMNTAIGIILVLIGFYCASLWIAGFIRSNRSVMSTGWITTLTFMIVGIAIFMERTWWWLLYGTTFWFVLYTIVNNTIVQKISGRMIKSTHLMIWGLNIILVVASIIACTHNGI